MSYHVSLLTLLITTARQASRSLERELSRVGIFPAHVPIYLALADKLSMTQKELALEAGVEQPTMALTLARMERDGLVSRKPNPRDGRSMLFDLTASAHAQIADLESALDVVERRVSIVLRDDDRVAVKSALRLIGAGLADERQDASDISKKATRHKPGEEPITSTPVSAGLEGSAPRNVPIALPETKVFREPGTDYQFPFGFEITTRRKKETLIAVVDDGGWVLLEDGETYGSIIALSMAVFGDAGNAWLNWNYKSEREQRLLPLYMYRHE